MLLFWFATEDQQLTFSCFLYSCGSARGVCVCVCFFVVCFFVLSRPTGARRRLFEEIPMHIHFSEQYAPILPSRPPGPLLSCSPLMGLLHLILSRSSGNHQQHSSMKRCIVLRLFDCFQMSVLFRHKCREGERVGGGGRGRTFGANRHSGKGGVRCWDTRVTHRKWPPAKG